MALTVSIVQSNPGYQNAAAAGKYVVAVTNTSSSSVTLSALQVYADNAGVRVSQPVFLTPNTPVGVGNPTITASGTSYFSFQVVPNSPYGAGPSPQAPGGPSTNASIQANADFLLVAVAQASDASVGSGSLLVPVLSAIDPYPDALGGAYQWKSGFNLINGIVFGTL